MRVAVYARVSSEDQAERKTIENQLEFARKYCDLHEFVPVEWYKDDGVTGTIPLEMREEGKRILEDAKAKRFDVLLIYRLDRLGRSARIILNAVYELEQYGVKIRSMTEPFDTGDPNGRFLLTILAGVADLERETILERMWYGANRAAREGKWLGGIVPYGYRINEEGYLEINEDHLPGMDMSEADVIRLIYRLIANQGYSTIKIADYLNALGVPPSYTKDGRQLKRGKRKENTAGIWRPGRIRNMIINTTYKGIHYYGKRTNKKRELIPREVPAIVSEEIWDKAQQTLKENQLEATRNAKTHFLLRGLIKCGCCGLSYHGRSYPDRNNKRKEYYVCGGKTSYRGPLYGKCRSKNVPKAWIEDYVWNDILNFVNHPGESIKELAATINKRESQRENLESEKEMISKAIMDKESEKQSILDLFRRKIITSKDVEEQIQKITQEKLALQQRISALERQILEETSLEQQFQSVEELLKEIRLKIKDTPPFEVKREIVRSLVKQITIKTDIDKDGRSSSTVIAEYNFSTVVTHTDVLADTALSQP
ncbi:recombinase family protein [Microaerobacter geothermalis]|uniref:recombinase family protein n=1 Tax=Microaerobacter geothermalis TaxID=674972 RepID=UPI001F30E215|nr:recombinase family protein [Microaerobacter geothermalis]MCF6094337.1 recombinase family protein [Microaerobacter geothermalis]